MRQGFSLESLLKYAVITGLGALALLWMLSQFVPSIAEMKSELLYFSQKASVVLLTPLFDVGYAFAHRLEIDVVFWVFYAFAGFFLYMGIAAALVFVPGALVGSIIYALTRLR
jgi:hypothetical protein